MREYYQSIARLKEALVDKEYLYLLIEPLFIYGIGIGVMILLIAWLIKSTPFQILSLTLVAVSSLAIFPYLSMRENAQQRIEKVYRIESPNRADDFKENTNDRKDHLWLYLAVSITAGFAAMIGPRRNRLGLLFAVLCVGFSIRTVHYSLWMHYQEALFSQPHLKRNDAPVKKRLRDKQVGKEMSPTRPYPV